MDLLTFGKALWRWSWAIALSAIIVGLSVYAVTRRMTPVYEAQTTVAVAFRSSEAANIGAADQEIVLDTYIQFLRQRHVLELVISEMNLNMSYFELAEKIQVAVAGRNTLLFRVTVQDDNPERAAQIANTLVDISTVQARQFFGPDRIASRALLRVVDLATPPLEPIQPRPLRSAVLFGVLAGMLASGVVVLKELTDTTIRTGDQVAEVMSAAPLAAIPTHSARSFLLGKQQIVSAVDIASPGAEAYRMLRTRVKYAKREQPIQSLTIVSANSGEGKSTTAANLAVVMAQSGQRVILVDADLRKPTLHTLFKHNNSHGLTTALEQHDGDWISDNLVSTNIEHLRLMPSGPLPHNPAEVLESARMRELHDTLLQYADVVIFDTSPLMRVVDAALVAHFTDTALAVVRANTTRAEALLQFRHRLEGFHVNLLGVVLNEAREELSGSYGYGYGSKPGGLLDDKADREQGTSVKMVEVPRNGKATPQDVAHIANSGGGSSFGATDSGRSHTG